jgi:hypothetical protein
MHQITQRPETWITEKKELQLFIRWKYPVGTIIQDPTCSEPFTIKKNSVFEIFVWEAEEYNPDFLPDDRKDYYVDFLVRDPGKHSRLHSLDRRFRLRECLAKYTDREPRWLTGKKTYLYTEDRVEITDPNYVCYCVNPHTLERSEVLAKDFASVKNPYTGTGIELRFYSTKELRREYISQNFVRVCEENIHRNKIISQLISDGEYH